MSHNGSATYEAEGFGYEPQGLRTAANAMPVAEHVWVAVCGPLDGSRIVGPPSPTAAAWAAGWAAAQANGAAVQPAEQTNGGGTEQGADSMLAGQLPGLRRAAQLAGQLHGAGTGEANGAAAQPAEQINGGGTEAENGAAQAGEGGDIRMNMYNTHDGFVWV